MWNLKLATGTVKEWEVDGKVVCIARVEERRTTRNNGKPRVNKSVRLYHPDEYAKLTERETQAKR